jgi:hypothetical protein
MRQSARIDDVIGALRDVARDLGHTPTPGKYERLRHEQLDRVEREKRRADGAPPRLGKSDSGCEGPHD